MSTKFILGQKVREKNTGFIGIVESRHEYIDGYVSYGVRPLWTGVGGMPDVSHISWKQLEVIE